MAVDLMQIITIEDIMNTMPHKFKNAKNAKIILEAYLRQYNAMVQTLIDVVLNFNIDRATGQQLDKIGANYLTERKPNESEEDYRNRIKLAYIVLQISGNIHNLSNVFKNYLNIDKDLIKIYEAGNANIVLELNKEKEFERGILNIINEIIKFGKPLGVGFSIEPYSLVIILDTYKQYTIDAIFDYFQGHKVIDTYNNTYLDLVKYPVTHRYLKETKKYKHSQMKAKTHTGIRFDRNVV